VADSEYIAPLPQPPPIPAEAELCADNAGTERVNGYYKRDGEQNKANGKPQYCKIGDESVKIY
jgi:hypothetical protein